MGKPFSVQPATDHDLIRSELCSKLTKTTPEKCHWSFWCLVIINFKNLSSCSSVTICYWDFSYAESKPSMQHLILVVLVRVEGQKFDNTTIVICLERNNRNLPCAEPAVMIFFKNSHENISPISIKIRGEVYYLTQLCCALC